MRPLYFSSPSFLFCSIVLFLASGVLVILIQPYQWSNLAATAWVSVARRVAPLSGSAVAEINPQIEQSPCWPLQTPKSHCVHPSSRDSLCLKLFSLDGGAGGTSNGRKKAKGECVRVYVCERVECVGSGWIEWAWDGQGRRIKMADWACLYFQWHFALRGRQKKCTANKAFKCAFFCLLQATRIGFGEPHSLVLHSSQSSITIVMFFDAKVSFSLSSFK